MANNPKTYLQDFGLAREEATRILRKSLAILDRIEHEPNLLKTLEDGSPPELLDLATVRRKRRLLQKELDRVEAVAIDLAFIGTVKAGKSTTLNAFASADLMPARVDPMTSLPTIVRHRPGQIEPVLILPTIEALSRLVSRVRERLAQLQEEGDLETALGDTRYYEVAIKLCNGTFGEFTERCEGRESVFGLLTRLNDFLRLCSHQAIALEPDEEVIGSPPIVEIAFHHLGMLLKDAVGSLSLLDSPGPNEARQGSRLRNIVKQQLDEASVVIVVTDFTQMNTDADLELAELATGHLSRLRDRLYVLVNKYDQDQRDEWSIERVRTFVVGKMSGRVSQERIFPVSSQQAFLANWALRELAAQGQLPLPEPGSNALAFGRSMGVRWRTEITQPELVRATADALWAESGFAEPLDTIMRDAVRNAERLAVEAALGRLAGDLELVSTFLGLRHEAALKTEGELQSAIKELATQVDEIRQARDHLAGRIARLSEALRTALEEAARDLREDAQRVMEHYVRTGRFEDPKAAEPSVGSRWFGRLRRGISQATGKVRDAAENILARVVALLESDTPHPSPLAPTRGAADFEPPDGGRQTFSGPDHADRAKKMLKAINARIRELATAADKRISSDFQRLCDAVSKDTMQNAEKVISEITDKTRKLFSENFSVQLALPKPELKVGEHAGKDASAIGKVKTEQFSIRETVFVEMGIWARIYRVWKPDYGTEIKEWTEEFSVVDLNVLGAEARTLVETLISEYPLAVERIVKDEILPAANHYFGQVEDFFGRMSGTIQAALDEKKLGQEQQALLACAMSEILGDSRELRLDSTALERSLNGGGPQ